MTQTQAQTVKESATINGTAAGGNAALADVICQMRDAITSGTPWAEALLEAVGRWPLASEELVGVRYQYLLLGEAFDWLALAGRLLAEVDGLAPPEDVEALLFQGGLPLGVTPEQFQAAIGPEKHRAYLNYYYGVVVEETLLLAVEEEIRKNRTATGLPESRDIADLACRRIYGAPQRELLTAYLAETGKPPSDTLSLGGLKEFTYWLFKRRIACTDSSKVASDTKKGLERLASMQA